MNQFITKHEQSIVGVLSGWDRVRFRGTFRSLAVTRMMMSWLLDQHVMLKHFKSLALELTAALKASIDQTAEAAGRSVKYLASSALSKEDLVRELIRREGISEPRPSLGAQGGGTREESHQPSAVSRQQITSGQLWQTLDDLEREHIARTLGHTFYNRSAAARLLGVTRQALLRKMKRYGIGARSEEIGVGDWGLGAAGLGAGCPNADVCEHAESIACVRIRTQSYRGRTGTACRHRAVARVKKFFRAPIS